MDGLSTRALAEVQSALPVSEPESSSESPPSQPQILEMHGRVFDVLCTSQACRHCETVPTSPICSALSGTEELVESGVIEPIIDKADLPRCSQCGDLARPGVVWFGEQPHHIPVIDKLVDQATLCLVVGTSSTVSFDPMCSVERAHEKMSGVPCSFLSEKSAETGREGRCIQSGKEYGRCRRGFLVSGTMRGNNSTSLERLSL